MELVTLGMFIIDDIHYPLPKPPSLNILGGAGSYAALGARLFRPSPVSKNVGWVIHKGSDFPPEIAEEIQSWDTSCDFQDTPWRKTTRGWNGYGEDERRDFKYTTEKMRVDYTQLTKALLRSKAFHLICTPNRCIELINGILGERQQFFEHDQSLERPVFVWEPVPDACGPAELQQLLKALEHVDVVSPNHHELASLFAGRTLKTSAANEIEQMKAQCGELHQRGFRRRRGAVVVRCGESGCYLKAGRHGRMFPAYHQSTSQGKGEPSKVIDPTGAGNAFLGAFAIGMLDASNPVDKLSNGIMYGTVAASFAVEQVGLPKLEVVEGEELWNGEKVTARWQALRDRLKNEREAPETD